MPSFALHLCTVTVLNIKLSPRGKQTHFISEVQSTQKTSKRQSGHGLSHSVSLCHRAQASCLSIWCLISAATRHSMCRLRSRESLHSLDYALTFITASVGECVSQEICDLQLRSIYLEVAVFICSRSLWGLEDKSTKNSLWSRLKCVSWAFQNIPMKPARSPEPGDRNTHLRNYEIKNNVCTSLNH